MTEFVVPDSVLGAREPLAGFGMIRIKLIPPWQIPLTSSIIQLRGWCQFSGRDALKAARARSSV